MTQTGLEHFGGWLFFNVFLNGLSNVLFWNSGFKNVFTFAIQTPLLQITNNTVLIMDGHLILCFKGGIYYFSDSKTLHAKYRNMESRNMKVIIL